MDSDRQIRDLEVPVSDPVAVILTNDKEFLEELLAKVIELQRDLATLTEIMCAEAEEAECGIQIQ